MPQPADIDPKTVDIFPQVAVPPGSALWLEKAGVDVSRFPLAADLERIAFAPGVQFWPAVGYRRKDDAPS